MHKIFTELSCSCYSQLFSFDRQNILLDFILKNVQWSKIGPPDLGEKVITITNYNNKHQINCCMCYSVWLQWDRQYWISALSRHVKRSEMIFCSLLTTFEVVNNILNKIEKIPCYQTAIQLNFNQIIGMFSK